MKKKSTITDLPNDLRQAVPNHQQNAMVTEIIKQAEAGEFHDFKSTLYACGKVQLVNMLYEANDMGAIKIREAVINGDYDESPDEEDKAIMKKDWIDNGGTIEEWEKLFGNNKDKD